MNKKKILGGLIGFILAILPIIGSCGLGILLYVRKKYKLLLLPALCVLFFTLATTVDHKAEGQRNHLQTSLSQEIENKIFSISFLSDKKLTIEQFSNTVQGILNDNISLDMSKLSEYPKLPEEYQKIIDKYYTIYETEYAKNLSTDVSFYVPVTEKKEIQAELNSFCSNYARIQHPDSDFFVFFMLSFFLLWLFSFPFSAYIFYKYLFKSKAENSENIVPIESIQANLNDTSSVDIDKIISDTEPQSPPTAIDSFPIKINYASETEIQEQLKMAAIQAKMIFMERETNGNFLDSSDFVKRTRLSERICNQFKDRLDFSLNNQLNKQSGRVLDI
jgi:hypothetical protein